MAKIFMPDLSDSERLNVMRNNADNVEETSYEKDLTDEELDAKREEFVDNSIKVSTLDDELNEIKASYKGKMEPIKLHNKILQQEVKSRKQKVKGTLFHMADHINGYMETYDDQGEMIASRRLRPDERQARLFVAGKAANGE